MISVELPVTTRDERGRMIHRKGPNYERWIEYDDRDNVTRTLSSTGMEQTWKYDRYNNLIKFTSGKTFIEKYRYFDTGILRYQYILDGKKEYKYLYDKEGYLIYSEEPEPEPIPYPKYQQYEEEDGIYYFGGY